MTRCASDNSIVSCKNIVGLRIGTKMGSSGSEEANCVVVPLTPVGIKLGCASGTY